MGSKRLASESYLDSSHQLIVPLQLPSQVTSGLRQSSSASGTFLQGDGQSQTPQSSQLNPSLGSSSNSVSGTGWSNLGPGSGDMYRQLNRSNSGPSVGASSLVTDANSALSGGAHLRRSSSINTESYMRLPSSPLSFSSNNIGISESSVMDGSSVVQQNSQQDQNPQKIQQRQHQQQQQEGASSSSSQLTSQTGKSTLQMSQEPHCLLPMQKKARLDIVQGDILQQQFFQQLLQRQGSFQQEGQNPWLQALLQQQRLLQQQHLHRQQILQSMPHMQQQQVRQQLQHAQHPASGMKQPFYNGICARRLMQYMFHQRQRPSDNSISYWRKFVAEYFAPHAKKRWCLSLYDTVGHNSLGVFPQATMLNAWHCEICRTKSGRGFEATVDILPRLSKIEFDTGVIDELLFADVPQEFRFTSGLMMLEYGKAIQESVYEQLRVVREGHLRIIFTPDLKILSWEFCARRHEDLLPRRLLAPQVNQLAQVAQKYLTTIESGSAGVSPQDLQTICNMFTTATCQLTRNLDLQLVNDLGFSKRYIRCLQISDVVSSMTDLINFSVKCKIGPIESLKEYSRQAAAVKLQIPRMQEMEQLPHIQGLSADQTTLNKMISMRPGLSSHWNNHTDSSAMNNCAQTAVALSNYQNLLRQSSMNSSLNSFKTEASYSFDGPNQLQSLPFQGPDSQVLGSVPNATVNDLSGLNQQPSPLLKENQQSSLANQHSQQRVIQQTVQEMSTNGGISQLPSCGQNANGNAAGDISSTVNGEGSLPLKTSTGVAEFSDKTTNAPDTVADSASCRTNSFKTATNNSAVAGGNGLRPGVLEDPHFAELLQDMPCEFGESGIFYSELGDIGYYWKS